MNVNVFMTLLTKTDSIIYGLLLLIRNTFMSYKMNIICSMKSIMVMNSN